MVSKEEWMEWLDSPVTKEFYKDVIETIEILAVRILNRTTEDQMDLFDKGFIKGVQELTSWAPKDKDDL